MKGRRERVFKNVPAGRCGRLVQKKGDKSGPGCKPMQMHMHQMQFTDIAANTFARVFFFFFSSVFPLFSFPAFHRIKHSFIDTIVAINFLSLFGSYVSGLSRMVKIARNTTSAQKYKKFGIARNIKI